jgi:hypothetical protein
MSTFDAWKELIGLARARIQLASMYWTLRYCTKLGWEEGMSPCL